MMKKTLKCGLLVAVCGSMLGFGGCLGGDGFWGRMGQDLASYALWEFVFDNDAIFDPIQDDWGTGVFHDDRFTDDPFREELPNSELDPGDY